VADAENPRPGVPPRPFAVEKRFRSVAPDVRQGVDLAHAVAPALPRVEVPQPGAGELVAVIAERAPAPGAEAQPAGYQRFRLNRFDEREPQTGRPPAQAGLADGARSSRTARSARNGDPPRPENPCIDGILHADPLPPGDP